MNLVLSEEEPVRWAEVIEVVAAALADQPLPEGDLPLCAHSLLVAVVGATPTGLRQRLQRQAAEPDAVGGDVEPLIYQNELPVNLLASGIINVAVQAVTAWRKRLANSSAASDGGPDARVLAIVAICALSTLRLDLMGEEAVHARVRRRICVFGTSGWAEALGSVADRTQELRDLLRAARNRRSQQWQHVTLEDRILAEAAAAAIVGGAATASRIPPEQWLFPFHLFCRLAVSAAEDALTAIERWLGVDFLPAPRTSERRASLAVLVADQAANLWQGCACKTGANTSSLAFAPRGRCRQPDHDLRSWKPGKPKPGSRNGSRYASTLWGWARRWLGGTGPGRTAHVGEPRRPRLHTNDVAGSVLARRWLSTDRGTDGPILLYDRILSEFCLRCQSKVQLVSHATGTRRMQVERTCCENPQRVYRSDFSERNGRRLPRPKLGIVIAWQLGTPGRAGYCPTAPLGPLWLCRDSGRYSCSQQYCPACGPDPGQGHQLVPYGWVLLPLGHAWQDLKGTAPRGGSKAQPIGSVGEADLLFLGRVFAKLWPETRPTFTGAGDVWAAAQSWSIAEMERFRELAGQPGLELLLRCKQSAAERGQDQTQVDRESATGHGELTGHGGEFVD